MNGVVNLIDTKKLENENEYEYIYRICSQKDTIGTWEDVASVLNSELNYEYTSSKYRKSFQYFEKMFSENQNRFSTNDGYLKELQEQKRELEKERKKLQTEKSEYNKWLRENAREELFVEKVIDAINILPNINIPNIIPTINTEKTGILIFGDEHYGVEFSIKGLFGEIINEYSPEIFEKRMWNLLNKTIDIVEKENFTKIHIFSMGDAIDGILRVSQLMKLRYGVVESAVKYADFIINWLNKLSEYVNIEFQMVHGNHSELRMLGQPKGSFENDNIGIVISEMIKTRLKDNPNFKFTYNPTGFVFSNIQGFNVLGIHGEVKSMERAIKDFSKTYGTEIDILIAGHLHHTRSEAVGVNSDVINVPSIIGVDSYSLSLNKTSNAGATFIIVEEDFGKVCEYNIKLN